MLLLRFDADIFVSQSDIRHIRRESCCGGGVEQLHAAHGVDVADAKPRTSEATVFTGLQSMAAFI